MEMNTIKSIHLFLFAWHFPLDYVAEASSFNLSFISEIFACACTFPLGGWTDQIKLRGDN